MLTCMAACKCTLAQAPSRIIRLRVDAGAAAVSVPGGSRYRDRLRDIAGRGHGNDRAGSLWRVGYAWLLAGATPRGLRCVVRERLA